MAQTYEVINARVKQKIATEAYWLSIEDELGLILEGEQAFVFNDAGQAVNFKIGDGTKKFSELPYFIAYYSGITSQKVLSWIDVSADQTAANQFRNNTLLTDIIIYNNSGTVIPLKIGTTNGGTEICSLNVPNGANSITRHFAFQDVETLYITGLTGLNCSVFLLYIQMDESPAIPPGQAAASKIPTGSVGIFAEVASLGLTYDRVWDFTTGLARLGYGYDNCVICGTNGTFDRSRAVSIPFKAGDVLGSTIGPAMNTINLTKEQLPPITIDITLPFDHYGLSSGSNLYAYGPNGPARGSSTVSSTAIGSGAPVSIQNYGIIDLWYQAIS